MTAAYAVLGYALCDGSAFAQLLAQHRWADLGDRRALVMACALLGHVVPLEPAAPDPRDRHDNRADLRACAFWAPERDVALFDAYDRIAVGAALEITNIALGRAE